MEISWKFVSPKKWEPCSSHQMVALMGWGSSSEQVWTGLQSWPPDVNSGVGSCTVRSYAGGGEGSLYTEVQASWVMVTWDSSRGQIDTDWKNFLPATSLRALVTAANRKPCSQSLFCVCLVEERGWGTNGTWSCKQLLPMVPCVLDAEAGFCVFAFTELQLRWLH